MGTDLKRLIDVATGRQKADLVLKNARIINVFTQEIHEGDVAVADGWIAGIGEYNGMEERDLHHLYLAPGLIDAHVHIESTMAVPGEFAKAVAARGTTTVIADPHEIANVLGLDGIQYILEQSEDLPVDVFVMFPSCVPATGFESSGARLEAKDLKQYTGNRRILGLGELMDYNGVVASDDRVLAKILAAEGKIKDGHAPGLAGKALNAYTAAGIKTDHECTTLEEMLEKLRLGFYVQIREGSAAKDLEVLIKGVNSDNMRRCIFCTDDRHLEDIMNHGHIDNNVRLAIQSGITPAAAVAMATLNAAECYRLADRGAIAPGYLADMIVIDDLQHFHVSEVYKAGKRVALDGKSLFDAEAKKVEYVLNTIKIREVTAGLLDLKLSSDVVNVIRVFPGNLTTEKVQRKVQLENGFFKVCPQDGILKLAVVERHKATGNIGLGLLENFGIRNAAIASTIAHDSHNLIVAGDNDADMLAAIEELKMRGGGITICSRGQVVNTLPLPVAGLLSDKPFEEINGKLKEMLEIAYDLGVNKEIEPFMTLSFVALPVIPEIRLTDRGLFDVKKNSFIPIEAGNF